MVWDFELFSGQISLRNGVTQVNEKELLQLVADCVLRLKPKVSFSEELCTKLFVFYIGRYPV